MPPRPARAWTTYPGKSMGTVSVIGPRRGVEGRGACGSSRKVLADQACRWRSPRAWAGARLAGCASGRLRPRALDRLISLDGEPADTVAGLVGGPQGTAVRPPRGGPIGRASC